MTREAELAAALEDMANDHQNMIDLCRLFQECVLRIASGKCADPRQDACDTLRGAGIIAAEALL